LTQVDSGLMALCALPGLWPEDRFPVTVGQVHEFFDGEHVAKVQREGYEEVFQIPAALEEVVDHAIEEAVKAIMLRLTSGPASVFKEPIPLSS